MKFRLAACLSALVLAACLGNSGSPAAPPGSVQTFAGDGAVSVTWNAQPGVNYWLFHAQDPTLSPTANWNTMLAGGAAPNIAPPFTLCGQINNPVPTSYFPPIFFSLDARTGTAAGGNGSAPVGVSPRPSGGGSQAPWVAGPPMVGNFHALAYVPITPCGLGGRPASGLFIAAGSGATLYTARLAPVVAGPLTQSTGNAPLQWTADTLPIGFAADLNGVAGVNAGLLNPAAPALVAVAVGNGGAILRSVDGINWNPVFGVPTTQNLRAVAAVGSAFVAVGDGGVVLNSNDGQNWLANTSASTVSSTSLTAVHCGGSTCVAVGPGGTTLWSYNSGSTWTLATYRSNDWSVVAYGNANVNADAIVSAPNGVLTLSSPAINTWIIADAAGNYAFTASGQSAGLQLGAAPIASSVAAIGYSSRFIALDGAGNAYASETGQYWQALGSSGVSGATGIAGSNQGLVALGISGSNASSY